MRSEDFAAEEVNFDECNSVTSIIASQTDY
jgi:hypothetical protein